MSVRVCVLASGSAANCIFVGTENTRILIDAGLSGKETARRLSEIGAELAAVHAVCITHEHDDHKASLGVLHRRMGIPVYANAATIEALMRGGELREVRWSVFETGAAFTIGELRIEPFSVPHDSYDPVGFVVSHGAVRVAVVTDMGTATGLIRERLKHAQVVVLECNHDEQMLKDAKRPWSLKQRIAGRQGHLSNRQAAELVSEISGPALKAVFLAHLSRDCNRPDLAVKAIRDALAAVGRADVEVKLTYPDRISEQVVVE
jgi:phosphoribosyl 1,2-cyclic phosphodiesterase